MRKLIFPLLASIVLPYGQAMASGTGGESHEMCIGYAAAENEGLNLGLYLHMIFEGAIQYDASEMQRLSGNQITKIRFKVGNNLTVQNNFVFITDDLEGEPLYRQPVENLKYGWNEISLDTPFEIDGRQLFIGFRYESSGEVLSLDGEEDNNKANWIRLSQDAEGARGVWNHQGGGALMIQAIVEGKSLPQHDVRIDRHNIRSYASTQMGSPMSLVVRNMGAATIHSLGVTLNVDGEILPQRIIDGLNIASNEISTVDIGELSMDSNNIFDVDITIDSVNGEADEWPEDNTLKVSNIISRKDYTTRKVLLEHFSTMKCANCPSAHATIDDALRYRDNVVHVVHHSGFDTDPLTIDASIDYLQLYTNGDAGMYYAPAASLDRVNLANYGATDGGQSTICPAFFPRRETMGHLIDTRLSVPALITVDIDHTYDSSSRLLGVTVSGMIPNGSPERLNAYDPRLTIMLTEDSIEGTQKGVSVPMDGPYIHNNVLRAVLTDVWGEKVTFNDGGYTSREFMFTLPEDWNDRNMRVIAFIHDYVPNNTSNWQVFNAEEVVLKAEASIDAIYSDSTRLRISIENGKIIMPEGVEYVSLYSVDGTKVFFTDSSIEEIAADNLGKGVYIVTARVAGEMRSAKIIIR